LGVLIEGEDELAEPVGVGGGIVVDDGDEFGGVEAGGEVNGRAEADVGRGMEDGDGVAGDGVRPIRIDAAAAAVIDDHNAKFPK